MLLRYDPGRDAWSQLPGPPSDRWYAIEAVGDSIIAFAGSEERGEQQEWRFHLPSATWAELPEDPLPLLYDRSLVAADGGRSALLFGANAEAGPTSEPSEEVNLAARLDLETMTWTELPPSPSRGFRAWGVDEVVLLEPHFGGSGGLFDPEVGTWSALSGADGGSFDANQIAGTFGEDGAVYVDASGWVFDADQRRWLETEPIDDRSVYPQSSITAVGRDLFVFGGERWTSSGGELLGDAWIWVAPVSESDASTSTTEDPTSTTSSPGPAGAEPAVQTAAEVFGGLTVHLELDATVVTSGGELSSRIVVENRSANAVTDPGCVLGASPHALLPADDPGGKLWLQPVGDCGGAFTYEPAFADTFDGPRFPARTKTGEPLAPGDYRATIEIDGARLSYPVNVIAP